MSVIANYCSNEINVCFCDWRSWSTFFLTYRCLIRFFENMECHLCIVDSAIYSNPCAFLNNLIVSVANLWRQAQNLMLLCFHPENSWFTRKFEINATTSHTVKDSLIHVNSLQLLERCVQVPSFHLCWNAMHLTENHILHHVSCQYFGF